MGFLLIASGGALGSIARFMIGRRIAEKRSTNFPLGTFLVNIAGAFLLGLLCSVEPDRNMYLLIGEGFLGSFTTFSTFMYEGFNLFQDNEKLNAAVYIFGSLLFGMTGFFVGVEVGNIIRIII